MTIRSLTDAARHIAMLESNAMLQFEIMLRLAAGLRGNAEGWAIAADATRSFLNPAQSVEGDDSAAMRARGLAQRATEFLARTEKVLGG